MKLQFSLTQLLMTVALAAILLTLARWERCEPRYSMLGSLEFSPDGKQLLVVRYDARNSNVPHKAYKSDLSRTISIIDVESGSVTAVLEQVLRRGDHGPAFGLFWVGRKSAAFGPEAGTVLIEEFGGGPVRLYDLNTRRWREPFAASTQCSLNLAVGPDRKLLATGYGQEVAVWDVGTGRLVQRIAVGPSFDLFMGSPAIALSSHGELLATGGTGGVELWNVKDGRPRPLPRLPVNKVVGALAFSPVNHTIAVSLSGQLAIYDMDRGQSRDLLPRYASAIAFSPDGRQLAAAAGDEAMVFDVASGRTLGLLNCDRWPTSIAFSPDGTLVALGAWSGNLSLWNPAAPEQTNTISVPGRTGYGWPLPLAMLLVWIGTCCLIWRRRRGAVARHTMAADRQQAETRTE